MSKKALCTALAKEDSRRFKNKIPSITDELSTCKPFFKIYEAVMKKNKISDPHIYLKTCDTWTRRMQSVLANDLKEFTDYVFSDSQYKEGNIEVSEKKQDDRTEELQEQQELQKIENEVEEDDRFSTISKTSRSSRSSKSLKSKQNMEDENSVVSNSKNSKNIVQYMEVAVHEPSPSVISLEQNHTEILTNEALDAMTYDETPTRDVRKKTTKRTLKTVDETRQVEKQDEENGSTISFRNMKQNMKRRKDSDEASTFSLQQEENDDGESSTVSLGQEHNSVVSLENVKNLKDIFSENVSESGSKVESKISKTSKISNAVSKTSHAVSKTSKISNAVSNPTSIVSYGNSSTPQTVPRKSFVSLSHAHLKKETEEDIESWYKESIANLQSMNCRDEQFKRKRAMLRVEYWARFDKIRNNATPTVVG